MSDNSKIEWCDATWNVITGCKKVSTGCAHCYAKTLHDRRHAAYLRGAKLPAQYAKPFETVQFHPERLDLPHRWKKSRRIFVNSMSDLFHEDVPDEFIGAIFNRMEIFDQHIYMVLTKRPDRMSEFCREFGIEPRQNIWLGVSIENQAAADERIPLLLQTPAAVRFVSCEPLLGAVDRSQYLQPTGVELIEINDAQREYPGKITENEIKRSFPKLDWVIVGGESGPGARPMHPDWARSLRDQCQEAGVPFFFKQWGEWHPAKYPWYTDDGKDPAGGHTFDDGTQVVKSGKTKSGRLLDGVEWNEFPEIARYAAE